MRETDLVQLSAVRQPSHEVLPRRSAININTTHANSTYDLTAWYSSHQSVLFKFTVTVNEM